ncbi:MAG: DUF465 domain-containing protein [Pseudomonadota bacterium]|nr:DUF465 domain-containing protein [Pseudomonadota bacterium]
MTHVPHELHEEFPEYNDKIHQMKTDNAHFQKLFEAYHEVNRAVHRAETDVEPTDDFHLEDMRKKRLALKDELYGMLKD